MMPLPFYVDRSWFEDYWYRETPPKRPRTGLFGNAVGVAAAVMLVLGVNVAGVALFAQHSAVHHTPAAATIAAPAGAGTALGSTKTG